MGHARLSPSSAERWMTCPGSVEFCKGIPDEGSVYAQDGTNAHELLNHCITNGVSPMTLVNTQRMEPESGTIYTVTQEMADAVNVAFNLINQRYQANINAGGTVFNVHSEIKVFPVRLGRFDIEGTCDIFIETDTYYENIDYKHGAGVVVEIVGNRQLQIYGIGALDTLGLDGDKPLVTTIVQPRAEHRDGAIRSVIYQPEDVAVFTQELIDGAARTDLPNAEFCVSEEGCRFCRGKATCTTFANHNLKAAQAVFSNVSSANTSEIQQNVLREPQELNVDQVRMILENAPLIISWVNSVQEFAKKQMLAGVDIPGFKIVAGNKMKQWDLEEEELSKLLRSMKKQDRKKITLDEIFSKKLLSPAAMEKALKGLLTETNWDRIKEHITFKEGAPKIAPASSNKPALATKPTDVFKDVSTPDGELPSFLQ